MIERVDVYHLDEIRTDEFFLEFSSIVLLKKTRNRYAVNLRA